MTTPASLQLQFARAAGLEAAADWESAAFAYTDLYRTALQLDATADAAVALRGQARVCRESGQHELAQDLSELSYEIAYRNGHLRDAARAVNTTATIRHLLQDLDGAVALYEQALELARDVGDDELIALAAQNVGIIRNVVGELDGARAFYLESIAAALRTADARAAVVAYMHLGVVCSDLDECLQAGMYLERALEIAQRLDNRMLLASVHANRARPLLEMGELDAAENALDTAERLAPRNGYPGTRSNIARWRATLARMRNRLDDADRCIAQALQCADEEHMTLERAEALEELASIRATQGRYPLARAALREAREIFDAAHALGWAQRADQRLAELAGETRSLTVPVS
ncbi:MAG: tetratricopeptide repeat protein [Longimicrobiales bacterium]